MIAVRGLGKQHGGRDILRGLSVDVGAGQVVALIGPSGGGKSTLLRCINGLEGFHAGEITVGGDALRPGPARANAASLGRIRRRVGFVFQQWNLFAHRTALDNVAEGPRVVQGVGVAEARARAHELLESVGLGHRAAAYPHQLSGGEQQRVAIARALAMRPEALLLDEPTSALDPERVGEVLDVLRRLAEAGMTLLIATHEMDFAREVATRVVVLHGGELIEDGAPGEVLLRPSHERTRAFLRPYLARGTPAAR